MKHKIFAGILVIELMTLTVLFVGTSLSARKSEPGLMATRELVRGLMLTDLALWTEARYTRHPSQADLFSPFQDFPSAIEHFPAGSIVVPPVMSYTDSLKSEDSDFNEE